MNLKIFARKILTGFLAAAIMTAIFTGCANETTSSEVVSSTTSVSDSSSPAGIQDTDTIGFSIKYKYWYENQESTEIPEGTSLDELFLNTNPIYKNENGDEYILSGRTQVFLHDRTISGSESLLLRTENGSKVYSLPITDGVAEKLEEFLSKGITQATTLADRQAQDKDETGTVSTDLPLYVNNLKTDYTTYNGKISVSNVLSSSLLGAVVTGNFTEDNKALDVVMYTAAGFVTVTFTLQNDNTLAVSYSTLNDTTTLSEADAILTGGDVVLDVEAMERVLGYDVEVYEDFVNVVTDNKDLFSSSIVLNYYDTLEVIDGSRGAEAFSELDPANPIPVSIPQSEVIKNDDASDVSDSNSNVSDSDSTNDVSDSDNTNDGSSSQEQAKPTTSDGKYTLAATDITNSDGTYTQTEYKPDAIPAWSRSDFTAEDWAYFFADSKDKSNPSAIPYSQITLENAAEAFPFKGYVGKWLDYIEVLPSDSADLIATKVYDNLIGKKPSTWGILAQYHNYATEEEYLAAEAERQAQADANHALGEAAEADDGPIGTMTDEEFMALKEEARKIREANKNN